jgi:hypothetical protein
MSPSFEQSPPVTFRPPELPAGQFSCVETLPAALTALHSAQRPPPSELTVLANRLRAVHLSPSPLAELRSIATALDFKDDESDDGDKDYDSWMDAANIENVPAASSTSYASASKAVNASTPGSAKQRASPATLAAISAVASQGRHPLGSIAGLQNIPFAQKAVPEQIKPVVVVQKLFQDDEVDDSLDSANPDSWKNFNNMAPTVRSSPTRALAVDLKTPTSCSRAAATSTSIIPSDAVRRTTPPSQVSAEFFTSTDSNVQGNPAESMATYSGAYNSPHDSSRPVRTSSGPHEMTHDGNAFNSSSTLDGLADDEKETLDNSTSAKGMSDKLPTISGSICQDQVGILQLADAQFTHAILPLAKDFETDDVSISATQCAGSVSKAATNYEQGSDIPVAKNPAEIRALTPNNEMNGMSKKISHDPSMSADLNPQTAQNPPVQAESSSITAMLQVHIKLLSAGCSQTAWREWVDAMDSFTKALAMDTPSEQAQGEPSREAVSFAFENRALLVRAIVGSLTEYRPSILASAYMLIDALVSRKAISPDDLNDTIVNKALDAASGAGVNSLVAARCLVGLVAADPDKYGSSHFQDDANSTKLRAACSKVSESVLVTEIDGKNCSVVTKLLDEIAAEQRRVQALLPSFSPGKAEARALTMPSPLRFAIRPPPADDHVKKLERQVDELQLILAQYEDTMTVMVEKEKALSSSSKVAAAEAENSRLKSELLEVTEAFDKLKERYDTMKAVSSERDVRETRLVEQNRELKKNLVDLQSWSNDLKANAEKKLSLSFESVSKFRLMYLDKEAREAKAAERLQVVQEELLQREEALTRAMVRVGQLETRLNEAEDARKSEEHAVSRVRAELGDATRKCGQHKEDLAELGRRLAGAQEAAAEGLAGADAAAQQAASRVKALSTENQMLKARAYDDLTRIKELESDVEAKGKEVDELNSICEELLGKLEAGQ